MTDADPRRTATEWPAHAPGQPPARARRRWLVPVIVISAFALLALIAIGVVWAVSLFSGLFVRSAPDQSLVEGERSSPVAVSPLECATACFTADSIEATLPPETMLTVLGVPKTTFPYGTYDPANAGDLYRRDATEWSSYNGGPDSCFFAPSSGPYAPSIGEANAQSSDLVYFTGTHEDIDALNTLDQSVRVFSDSASAAAFMSELSHNIDGCDMIVIGPKSDRYSADIGREPALALPDSVAGVGWVRIGDPGIRWRAYIVDLQRGNLVVMTRLLTDGSITELQFRSLLGRYAAQLDAVEPVGTPIG